MHKNMKGFTLMELIVVLVISAIIMAVAVPAFESMIAQNRIVAETNDILVAINLARSEALRTGSPASVQAVDPSNSNDEFGKGYCVVDGTPGDCTNAIRKFDALPDGDTLNSLDNLQMLEFNSLGGLANTTAATELDLCNTDHDGRRIVITLVGRSKSHDSTDPVAAYRPSC